MAEQQQLFKQLRRSSYKGVEFPVSSRTYGFRQDDVRHRIIQRDLKYIESLGLDNPTWSFTIPGYEGLFRAPWSNWFTKSYAKFIRACLDRTPGELIDPLHGPVSAVKCITYSEDLVASIRDGVALRVDFAQDNDDVLDLDGIAGNIESFSAAFDQAAFLDQAVIQLDRATRDQIAARNLAPPEPTLDVFQAMSAVVDQTALGAEKALAYGSMAISRLEGIKDSVDRIANPRNASLRSLASRLQAAALELPYGPSQSRPALRIVRVENDTGRIALAREHGISTAQLLKLNPHIARTPNVESGTRISVPRK